MNGKDDTYDRNETQRRLEAALRGAFKVSPTPLKDITKKNNQRRRLRQRKKRPD